MIAAFDIQSQSSFSFLHRYNAAHFLCEFKQAFLSPPLGMLPLYFYQENQQEMELLFTGVTIKSAS